VIELSIDDFEELRHDNDFVLYRGQRRKDLSRILVLAPAAEYPRPESLKRLEHEYSFKEELDPAWAARPIGLARHGDRTVLVLEDPGGVLLESACGSRGRGSNGLDLAFYLPVGVNLANAIGHLHRRGIVHKDVKPANVLVNPATGQVWLMGFGIASRLRRERRAPASPELLEGTLAYMAPEQTGRMNRSIDSRSDLYSFGVTLYEMLTGSLPFTASDPMEWVHCHIARKPAPPSERLEDVPPCISAIVMKLLAKTAEERYQTATGVENDLRRCLAKWERGSDSARPGQEGAILNGATPDRSDGDSPDRIQEFRLGEHDIPDRLLIPEKLYGRALEIETLLAAFDRVVASGKPELVLVSGYSGIGKSSVVNELHKPLVPPRGLFASGKFDQYKRDVPYSTLAQAFQSLVRPLLSKSEAELLTWRDALREALGPNGLLMVDLVPELKLIIGEQQPVPELPAQDAQRRFHLVFRRFLSVFARPEHPLALFLDDLQWLDAATLDLLEDLLTQPDVQHLMLIGAYRDNEVDSTHPLMRKLEAIRGAGARALEITLTPLSLEDLGQLIADSLHCEVDHAIPVAQLVQEKAGGNPFFAIQFISALAEERLLTFQPENGRWSWDLNRIRAKSYTDNVVELMAGKLRRFSAITQEALKQLACLGNVAEIATITLVHGETEKAMHAALWEAVHAGLVFREDSAYKFLHDRIQQAAYTLIPEEHRAEIHWRIGRVLLASMAAAELAKHLFDVANQLNRGAALLIGRDEKAQVAAINLRAGRKAKASAAFASACVYLAAGMALLDERDWDSQYELMFNLWLERAECEFLTGSFDTAEQLLGELLQHGASKVDQAAAYHLKIRLCTVKSESAQAVAIALTCLRLFGTDIPTQPTWEQVQAEYETVWQTLNGRPIEELIDLPLATDPELQAAMQVLSVVIGPAYFTNFNLCSLLACRMVNASLQHGMCGASVHGCAFLGSILGPVFHRYSEGYRFAKLACDLVEKHGFIAYQAKAYHTMGQAALWTEPIATAIGFNRAAFRTAIETGALTCACYSMDSSIAMLLQRNDPLDAVWRESEKNLDFVRKARFHDVAAIIVSQQRFIATMQGRTISFSTFSDGQFDEEAFEAQLTGTRTATMICIYWIVKLKTRFLSGDHAEALGAADKAKALLWAVPAHIQLLDYFYYAALTVAALYEKATADEQTVWHDLLTAHRKQLREWAENYPPSFGDKYALVSAEFARIEGRDLDAMRLYQEATRAARENGFVHNEALAHELAARFFAARGFEDFANLYLRKARYCYLHWGADGKVRQLEQLYPQLREAPSVPDPTKTIETPLDHLDLATVIKMSQAISGEILLEKLIETLLKTAVEQAGAERGLLVLPDGEQYRIEAEIGPGTYQGNVRLRQASLPTRNASAEADAGGSSSELPESLLRYVIRSQEKVILDDASTHTLFSEDEYLRQRCPKSVLCLPLIKQSKLISVLYLENNLAPSVFTPSRAAMLELLASQAAISLDHARLYSELSCANKELKTLKDRLHRENIVLREEIGETSRFEEIVGRSPLLKAVLAHVTKVAPTDSTVLITGETGTGKELIARAIHKRSHRSERPFVKVSCAAIPPSLIASELFGHEKGSFTGALQQRLGRFELAEHGTIFLDEIGELPPETQVALLRVLQEREFERVGGNRPISVDVRVIAATNRDLRAAIATNEFRSDLFYRINVFPIEMPPLRARTEDIPMLVKYFIDHYARKAGKQITSIDNKTLELLESYPWPGNIRELQNVIERSVIICDSESFSVDESWLTIEQRRASAGKPALSEKPAEEEKVVIEAALAQTRGRVSGPNGAAAKLGVSPSTLESRIRALKIDKRRFRYL
jgi:predicted ATPase